jgi:hypothetical protein
MEWVCLHYDNVAVRVAECQDYEAAKQMHVKMTEQWEVQPSQTPWQMAKFYYATKIKGE